jgi:FAD/FMN-containing dehydrogenase
MTAPTDMVPALADDEFVTAFRGELIGPYHPAYDEARSVYNGMIDRRPAMIARCRDAGDVMAAVRLAGRTGIPMAVRGGGHNAGGLGVVDDGLVIDLSQMRGVRVDPDRRTVRAEGGALLGDMDHATHPFGLAVPCGILSTTGVGGLTLGGGIGHLTRRHGLSVDNLLSADVVLADGRMVVASETRHPDLFWALRGGGGNFGVVTSFEFRAQPVSTVVGGPTLWPMEMAADAMRFFDEVIRGAPDDLNGFFAFLTVPPAPPFPPELHMQKMCGVVWCWSGPAESADAVFAPVRAFGPPALDGIAEMPLPVLQSAFDPLYPKGLQWYWKGDFMGELSDEAIAAHVEHGARLPTMLSSMHLYPIDGAAGRVARDATAFARRDARYSQVIVGVDPDPANAEEIRTWARDYYDALRPRALGGSYVNFLQGDEAPGELEASYGGNWDRLVEIKRRYDPDNRFRHNRNIAP